MLDLILISTLFVNSSVCVNIEAHTVYGDCVCAYVSARVCACVCVCSSVHMCMCT